MTLQEWREHPEYKVCMNKILKWKKGKKYTVYYCYIPEKKRWFIQTVLDDAVKQGLIESVALGLNLDLLHTEETFLRK